MANYILVLFSFTLGLLSTAQISTNSPYSSQGIGDVSFYGNAYLTSLGGASTAVFDSSQVNLFNPSSYSHVTHQLPLFSLGLAHEQQRFSTGGSESSGSFSGITHMSLIIPFANRFGLAFGIKPLSRTGYEINDHQIVNGDSLFHDYNGSGAIQEAILGFSATIIKRRKHALTIGVNGKHYFGSIINRRTSYSNTNVGQSGGFDKRELQARAIGGEIGLNYNWKPSTEHEVYFGATYRLEQSLNARRSDYRVYFSSVTNTNSYDTLLSNPNIEGSIELPERLSLGASYIFTPQPDESSRSSKSPLFMLTGEWSTENWSTFTEEFNGTTTTPDFRDLQATRVGFEYSPHYKSNSGSAYLNFFDRFRYRLGAYTVNTQYLTQGEGLVDRGITAGVGIPIVINRAVSSVNFSARVGELGAASSAAQLNEGYFGFNFGINIAPSYDKWFRKYKLD